MQTAYHPQGSTKWGFTAGFTGRQAELLVRFYDGVHVTTLTSDLSYGYYVGYVHTHAESRSTWRVRELARLRCRPPIHSGRRVGKDDPPTTFDPPTADTHWSEFEGLTVGKELQYANIMKTKLVRTRRTVRLTKESVAKMGRLNDIRMALAMRRCDGRPPLPPPSPKK